MAQYIMPDAAVHSDMADKPMPQVASYCDGMVARQFCTASGFHDLGDNLTPGKGSWATPVTADWKNNEEAQVI